LAKALASVYSASKQPQVYTMGNFTEAHTVSGIIGVPPGYVGHEQGGRLVNDLNSDPYCVFLLDEAEKAHPDIWKPFLNLFDEAWVVDQRGVKAFADRAIFILTSNAGAEIIARSTKAKVPMAEIVEEVREALPQVRNERSNQPVFSPEFLARIRRIIVFKPLSESAMFGICEKIIQRKERDWSAKREKRIVVPQVLKEHIARLSYEMDRAASGKEGGRIVAKNVSLWIDVKVQVAAQTRPVEYENCRVIELAFDGRDVAVHFRPEA
jgi:ATP-dependent Clp protease ATP-binding subunit ClpA